MEIVQLKVSVDELVLGMYISKLDRPWLETPFKLQGFLLRDDSEIEELQKHCKYVYVDIEKGLDPLQATKHAQLKPSTKQKEVAPATYKFTAIDVRHDTYREAVGFSAEAKEVNVLQADIDKAMTAVTQQISSGKSFDQASVKGDRKSVV